MIKTCIIEDEDHARINLQFLIQQFIPFAEVVGTAKNVSDGIELIRNQNPDVLLLDVRLGSGTGFDILNRIVTKKFKTIFVTAYENYALKALKQKAFDYLLKPVALDELEMAFKDIVSASSCGEDSKPSAVPKDTIALPGHKATKLVELDKMICLIAERAYCKVFIENDAFLISKSLSSFDAALKGRDNFLRINRSAMVNLDQVQEIGKTDGGFLLLSNGRKVFFSHRSKDKIIQTVLNYRSISL